MEESEIEMVGIEKISEVNEKMLAIFKEENLHPIDIVIACFRLGILAHSSFMNNKELIQRLFNELMATLLEDVTEEKLTVQAEKE